MVRKFYVKLNIDNFRSTISNENCKLLDCKQTAVVLQITLKSDRIESRFFPGLKKLRALLPVLHDPPWPEGSGASASKL